MRQDSNTCGTGEAVMRTCFPSSGVQAMRITADVVLPTNLTSDEEYQIIGTDDPGKGRCIQYQQEIVFKSIVLFATRPLAKVMGFHPATTLHISWGSSATRAEARSDFLEYLHERGLPEDFTKRCGLLFDNAVAVDEDGNFCD